MPGDSPSEFVQPFRFRAMLDSCLPVVLRGFLGAVLVAAGIGKMFSLPEFAESFRLLVGLSHDFAMPAAVAVVAFECLMGVGFLISRHTRLLAVAGSVLFGTFAVVLTAARLLGRSAPCGCFGLLPVRLSNELEVLLDLLLLNLSVMLWVTCRGPASGRRVGIWRWMLPVGGLCVQAALFSVAFSAGGVSRGESLLVQFAEAEQEPFRGMASRPRLMLVADIHDFSCLPCFEDFLALCDAVGDAGSRIDMRQVVILLSQRGGEGEPSAEALQTWARETGIHFGVGVLPESVAIEAGVRSSVAILLHAGGAGLVRRELPVGCAARDEIVRLLSADGSFEGSPR